MKITNIELIRDMPMVQSLLEKEIYSDSVMEDTLIDITLEDIKPMDYGLFPYRKLWEDLYLKFRKRTSYLYLDNSRICLIISLSEALGFIYKATPPRLQEKIKNSTNSIDKIIDLLKFFLMEESKELPHYLSIFYEHIHFQKYKTNFINEDLIKRVDMMHNMRNYDHPIIYVITSTIPIDSLISYNDHKGSIYAIIRCANHKEICEVINFINDNSLLFDNVTTTDDTLYILTYSSEFDSDEETSAFIEKSYEPLLNR